MKTMLMSALAVLAAAGLSGASNEKKSVWGQYIEARTCDVWTGPCFSNAEVNLKGKEAVAGWVVEKGTWDGQTLDGLKVVAALTSEGTLHTEWQGAVKAALYVDEKASECQAKALVAMAKALSPKLLADVVKVERGAIAHTRDGLEAVLTVGKAITIKTTAFCPCDSICCHEERAYPSVSESTEVECAKTLENSYKGEALTDVRWSEYNKRSGMVGRFAK